MELLIPCWMLQAILTCICLRGQWTTGFSTKSDMTFFPLTSLICLECEQFDLCFSGNPTNAMLKVFFIFGNDEECEAHFCRVNVCVLCFLLVEPPTQHFKMLHHLYKGSESSQIIMSPLFPIFSMCLDPLEVWIYSSWDSNSLVYKSFIDVKGVKRLHKLFAHFQSSFLQHSCWIIYPIVNVQVNKSSLGYEKPRSTY